MTASRRGSGGAGSKSNHKRQQRRRRPAAGRPVRHEPLESRVLFAANLLDPSFGGGDGIATTNVAGGDEGAAAVVVLSSGKVLTAGYARGPTTAAGADFALARFNADGSPDATFGGGDGKVTVGVGTGDDVGTAMAVLSSGKVLVAGSAVMGTGTARRPVFALVRFNADGSLDTTFGGGDGKVTTAIGTGAGTADVARAVLVLADGDVVVGGGTETFTEVDGFTRTLAVVRYNANGTVDTAFGGGDGIVTTNLEQGSTEQVGGLARGPGGTFYAGSLAGGSAVLVRYKADGTLDASFDTDGIAVNDSRFFGFNDSLAGLAALPDGRVLVSGNDGSEVDVARFKPDGTTDASFGGGGVTSITTFAGGNAPLAVLPDGKFVTALGGFAAARFNADGSSDPTFDGEDGVFEPDLTAAIGRFSFGFANAVAVDASGRPVLAGAITSSGTGVGSDDTTFGLARLKNIPLTVPVDPDDQIGEATVTLAPGGSRSGAINPATDVDAYKVTVAAGQRLAFDLDRTSGSALDSMLRVFDADGNEVARNDDAPAPGEPAATTESYLRVFFATAGTYYVAVSGSANASYDPRTGARDVAGSSGGYTLRVADAPPPADPDDQIAEAPTLAVGAAPRAGAIDPDTDVDLVKFTVTAGQRVGFDVDTSGTSTLDAMLRLFAADGTQLAVNQFQPAPGEAFSNDPYIDFTFPTAGTYYAGVSAEGNPEYNPTTGAGDRPSGTGTYSLALVNIPGGDPDDQIAEAPALAAGATAAGAITPGTDVDVFKVVLPAGKLARFDLDRPAGSALDATLRLFDAAGAQVAISFEDAAPGEALSTDPYLQFAPAADGTYFIAVSGNGNSSYDPITGKGDFGGSKGDYRLTFSVVAIPADPDDQISEAKTLPVGPKVVGALGERDVDMYKFFAVADEGIAININETGANVILRLFDVLGGEIAASEGGLFGSFFESGTYYLGVSGSPNSSYNPLTGLDDRAGSTGSYEVTLTKDEIPPDLDDQIAEAKPIGAFVDAKLTQGTGDVDMYKFTAAAGEEVDFSLKQSNVDAVLRVFDADGEELAFGDEPARVDHVFEAAGTYYIGVSGYPNTEYDPVTGEDDDTFGDYGNYRLVVARVAADPDDSIAEAKPIALNTPTSAALGGATDVDVFKFAATAGQAIVVDLDRVAGGLVDGALRVFDAEGELLALDIGGQAPDELPNREAYATFVPEKSGTYYFGVSGGKNVTYDVVEGTYDTGGSTAGAYKVTVRLAPNDPDDQLTEASAVALNGSRIGSISIPGDVDLFKFTVAAGDRIALDLDRPAGSGLDAVLRLFDASGSEVLFSDDDPAPGEAATTEPYLEFVSRGAATYYVGVSGNNNTFYSPFTGLGDNGGASTGDYVLRFNRLT